ncbi:hypothetical protein NVP1052A_68 [Vibrio phage 1.052.A._10N.286.46.C3]|nr:hypothetical protein NVP1052A_68 [Vibrio phage 1.052.A._10N.286.46.C3]
MIEKTSVVYIAKDGREFTDKKKAEAYEKRIDSMKLWSVTHGFDCTEGKGYYSKTYLNTEGASKDEVEDYCYRNFGRKVVYVQGVERHKQAGWILRLIDDKESHVKKGSMFGCTDRAYNERTLVWSREAMGLIDLNSAD